ncbi:uncharacterized protein LOC134675024 [Cydia fagiglandana]|uniref:uncharacterized protein LOC134675024 n=1 Tax=Cydia fagiglandana TaxID=1458189 RepID=UPI002FEE0103
MDLPTMAFPLYSSTHDDVAEMWRITAEQTMQKAAEEERDAAISRGDVNDAGIATVPVEADACWSKRSYRTNYSALSGCAAIIGEHTGKVLHTGVRNRYCVICARAQKKNLPPRQHNCTKNHVGSATSMEQAILVEGFKCSVEERNLIYKTLIADGDSSTYKNIVDSRPYPNVFIQKIECTNHLLRNYNGKNMQLPKDTTIPLKERKLLTSDRITRLRTAIRSASKYRNEENNSNETKIKNLQKDIINSIYHIFGDHAECEDYYCTQERKAEQNLVPLVPTLMTKLRKNASQLALNSRSLLYNFTNNRAEQFNSMVAKVVGGKRVNFSLKDSYKARCYAAVVAFNTGKAQCTLYKTLLSKSPGVTLKRLERKRHAVNELRTEKPKRYRKRILFSQTDGQYGQECQRPDMNKKDFDHAKDLFLDHLKKQALKRFEIERSTILQAESALWLELRRCILTASLFGKICKRRPNLNSAPLVKSILYSYDLSHVPSIRHGKENEAKALEQLGTQENINIQKCGLFIHEQYCFLGASPDGICQEGLVEIKCPFSAFGVDPDEAIATKKIKCFKRNNAGKYVMDINHDWYYQIQGQLHIADKRVCIFAIWTGPEFTMKVVRIPKDDDFWEQKMLPKLSRFYHDCVLLEIIDPRKSRSMAIRDIKI